MNAVSALLAVTWVFICFIVAANWSLDRLARDAEGDDGAGVS